MNMITNMNVIVDESAPGTGKTFNATMRMVTEPGLYLFVTERLESITEIDKRVYMMANRYQRAPKVHTITSDQNVRGYSVRQEVESLASKYDEANHVIAICSHAAMLMSDFSDFTGWHIIIDEIPAVLDSQEVQSMLDTDFFEKHYQLTEHSAGWSYVTLTEQGAKIDGADLLSDDSHRHLRIFHRRVTDASTGYEDARSVICNLKSWDQMKERDTKWIWGSLFTLTQLETFATVTMLGNGFMQSLAAKLLQRSSPDVQWEVRNTVRADSFTHRNVKVVYFANSHCATKYFLDSEAGRSNLKTIAEYVSPLIVPGKLIWSCNDVSGPTLAGVLPQHGRQRPKQAGADNLMHCSQALMLYSAKPSPNIHALCNALEVSKDDWIASNEFETILQFVTRTSIRSLDNGQDVTVWLYDEAQANYLMSYLETLPHVSAECEYVDLGLNEAKGRGRPKLVMTPEEAEAHKAERKAKKAAKERARYAKAKVSV